MEFGLEGSVGDFLFVGERSHKILQTPAKNGSYLSKIGVQILVVTPTCRQQKMFGFSSSELDLKQRRFLLSQKRGANPFKDESIQDSLDFPKVRSVEFVC